jgi:hypothetical protein
MSNALRDQMIDIRDEHEVKKWCDLLNCTEEDLRKAVMQIGSSALIVDNFLFLNRKKINKQVSPLV